MSHLIIARCGRRIMVITAASQAVSEVSTREIREMRDCEIPSSDTSFLKLGKFLFHLSFSRNPTFPVRFQYFRETQVDSRLWESTV